MTREEAAAILESEAEYLYSQDEPYNREAFRMAIEALKAESTTSQVKVDASINKPTERWDTCGLSENDILLDSGSRGERRQDG